MVYNNISLDPSTISAGDQSYVNRVRRFLNDSADLNVLTEALESTDTEIFEAIQDALDDVAYTPPILLDGGYSNFNEVPWIILRSGAVLNVLTTKGILSARNTLTYRDSGGVTVQNFDKYGRYQEYFNQLTAQYEKLKKGFKISKNIDNCYGNVPSEYSLI